MVALCMHVSSGQEAGVAAYLSPTAHHNSSALTTKVNEFVYVTAALSERLHNEASP
jgi:hypothetical protein